MGMLIDRVVAKYFATNCWIIAPSRNSECIIVDPGIGSPYIVKELKEKFNEYGLKPVATLITHGHLDHTFSVLPLQQDCGVTSVLMHPKDRDLLSKPERALGAQGLALLDELRSALGFSQFEEPSDVGALNDGEKLVLAGLNLQITSTPGHTPGSIVVSLEDKALITGDTLFAGSIGRTDLPRGSISDMEQSLREKIAPMSPDLEILPGHGERSRLGIELQSNPYLRAAIEGKLK